MRYIQLLYRPPAKHLVLYILCFACLPTAFAQTSSRVPANVHGIFDDLPIDDPAASSRLRPGEDTAQKIKDNIFIGSTCSHAHCYLGEAVLLTYTLYSALQSTSTVSRAPSFEGFSVAAMDASNEQVIRKKQNGKNYRVFTLQQLQLTPLREGTIVVDPMQVDNLVRYKEGDRQVQYGGSIAGQAISISVEPLPVVGQPTGFSGAIGDFTVKALADTAVNAGENNTLHIEITGRGNFAALPVPDMSWPPGVEHFSVNSHQQMDKKAFPPAGKKIFDIPFVAAKEGNLVLPPVQVSFFDPQKKIYRVARSGALTIHVLPALPKKGPAEAPATIPAEKPAGFNYRWLLLPVLILALAGFFYRRSGKAATTGNQQPIIEPVPVAPEKTTVLPAMDTLRQHDDSTAGYVTTFKALLNALLRDKTGLALGTEEDLLQAIKIKDADLAADTADLYARCNALLYAPGSLDTSLKAAMEEQLAATEENLNRLFL